MTQDPSSLAKSIDHTLLKPESTKSQYERLCTEAREYSFASVCIPPTWLKYCGSLLSESNVKLCTVIGFPLGYHDSSAKTREAELAIVSGADELDMVLNYSALINGDEDSIKSELKDMREISSGKVLKLILETCYLNTEQIQKACLLALENKFDFVKTSTGFGTGGATVEDIQCIQNAIPQGTLIKASGGIQNKEQALKFLELGVHRLGCSKSVDIVTG